MQTTKTAYSTTCDDAILHFVVVRYWLMSRSTTNLPQHQFPRVQQRTLILKDPPFLRYTGPLATAKYHEIAQHFEKLYSPTNYEQIKKFAQNIVNGSHIELDLKAFALCWEASSEIFFVNNMRPVKNCSELLGRKHHQWNVKMDYCYKE